MRKIILPAIIAMFSVSVPVYAVVSSQYSMTQFSKNGVVTNVSSSDPLPTTGGSGGSGASSVTVSGPITVNQGNAGFSSWPVSMSTIPVGAATSALQLLGNASLSSIDSKVPSNGQTTMALSLPVVLANNQSAVQVALSSVLPLPTGAATAALQQTGNASLALIAGLSTVNSSGFVASGTVSTVATLSAPLGAVGFILMNMDTSTANIRWAVGSAATTAIGQQLQPGRSSDLVPTSANVSIIAESGTQNYGIQWIVK